MKKLLRYAILIVICLILLLGCETFSILTCTNTSTQRTLFSFTQNSPGLADVVLLGHPMSWNLTPFLKLRESLGTMLGDLPAKCVGAACSFFEAVIDAFA